MLIRRMYIQIKCECVALIFFLFCEFLFTEIRKETISPVHMHGAFIIRLYTSLNV